MCYDSHTENNSQIERLYAPKPIRLILGGVFRCGYRNISNGVLCDRSLNSLVQWADFFEQEYFTK